VISFTFAVKHMSCRWLFYCIIFLTSVSVEVKAQAILLGKVISNDSAQAPLANAGIFNLRSNQLVFTNELGEFTLIIQPGDSVRISHIGFVEYRYYVRSSSADKISKKFFLLPKKGMLEELKVSSLTKYQRDSIATARMFSGVVGYEQTTTVFSPVTSLYEQFSKKYKDLRKLQSRIHADEEQKYIDTKYTYELVNSITKLEGDSAALFMNAYPMEHKFARLANEAEIKMWIITNYRNYRNVANANKKQ
jgi:hypothetical protein